MHAADTRERDHLGLLVTPARERERPLVRALQRADLLTGVDHAAVEEPRDHRRQLAARDGDHHFVEQGQAFLHAALAQPDASEHVVPDGDDIRLREAFAHRRGVAGGGRRGLQIACGYLRLGDREQQVSPLDAVARLPIEQPPRAAEPAVRVPDLAPEQQAQSQPERRAHRVGRGVLGAIRMVGALQLLQVVGVAADEIRRQRQAFEILARQRARPVGARQHLVSGGPGPLPVELTSALDIGRGGPFLRARRRLLPGLHRRSLGRIVATPPRIDAERPSSALTPHRRAMILSLHLDIGI